MNIREAKRRRHRGQRAWTKGRWAEYVCVVFLKCKGWTILARRYRTPLGEIDLIVRRGSVIAAIEVKSRPTLLEGGEAISKHQRRRIMGATRIFLARYAVPRHMILRFDAIIVRPWRWPYHITNAWLENSI